MFTNFRIKWADIYVHKHILKKELNIGQNNLGGMKKNMDQVFSSVFVSNRRSPELNQRSLEHIDKMEQVYFPVFVADKSLSKD